jgi:hypothetical protein
MWRIIRVRSIFEASFSEGRGDGDEDEELWRMWDEMLKEISDFEADG